MAAARAWSRSSAHCSSPAVELRGCPDAGCCPPIPPACTPCLHLALMRAVLMRLRCCCCWAGCLLLLGGWRLVLGRQQLMAAGISPAAAPATCAAALPAAPRALKPGAGPPGAARPHTRPAAGWPRAMRCGHQHLLLRPALPKLLLGGPGLSPQPAASAGAGCCSLHGSDQSAAPPGAEPRSDASGLAACCTCRPGQQGQRAALGWALGLPDRPAARLRLVPMPAGVAGCLAGCALCCPCEHQQPCVGAYCSGRGRLCSGPQQVA